MQADEHNQTATGMRAGTALKRRGLIAGAAALAASAALLRQSQSPAATDISSVIYYRAVDPFTSSGVLLGRRVFLATTAMSSGVRADGRGNQPGMAGYAATTMGSDSGQGMGSGPGTHGIGGTTSGAGVLANGGAPNGNGVEGNGTGTGAGVVGNSAGSGAGVYGQSTSGSSTKGVHGKHLANGYPACTARRDPVATVSPASRPMRSGVNGTSTGGTGSTGNRTSARRPKGCTASTWRTASECTGRRGREATA